MSLGSNTSNAVAPLLWIDDETFGLDRCFFTTVHAFTNSQRLADVPEPTVSAQAGRRGVIIPAETNSRRFWRR